MNEDRRWWSEVARWMLAIMEDRVVTEPTGRVWVYEPTCDHLGHDTEDNFCSWCGAPLCSALLN